MRAICWNCRGICNASTVRALKAQISGISPNFIFLCETKASDKKMQEVMEKLVFHHRFVVDAKGKAGGLAILWKFESSVRILEYNKNLIAIKISDPVCDWVLVGFYGPPYPSKKAKAWQNLAALLESVQCPWVSFGDFNYTLSQDDISGGSTSRHSATNHLSDLMFEFNAVDLGFSGNKFT